jgi:cob(I)alamin adenosyltransferase
MGLGGFFAHLSAKINFCLRGQGMRLTKIYTKIGDKGSTMLAGGGTISKDSLRIDCYGTVDELNAFIGLWRDALNSAEPSEIFKDITGHLALIQNEMHDLGGELSTPNDKLDLKKQQVVNTVSITRLENEIDHYNGNLPPLTNFVLPGGHQANSLAHVCRTICRRAERLTVALSRGETIRSEACIYLNRLSDWFFVMSRVVSQRLSVPEILWFQAGKSDAK